MPVDPRTSMIISGGQVPANPTVPQMDTSAPNAPDLGGGPAGSATSALGGTMPTPARPPQNMGQHVANFISGGQQSPGSLMRGILAGALTGMVAGSAQPHMGQGVAAGGAAEQKVEQQRLQNQVQMTREQGEQKVRQAQLLDLNHRITASAWDLSQKKAGALQQQAQLENGLKQMVMQDPGNRDLGVFQNIDDVIAHHKGDPDLPANLAKGNILTTPHFTPDADGNMKYDGVSAVYVTPEWKTQKIDHDVSVPKFQPPKKPGEPGTWGTYTFKAGTITNEEAAKATMDQSAQVAKYDNDKALAQANKAAADAQVALAKAATTKEQAGQLADEAKQVGQALVEGDRAPSQLNRRSKNYDAQLAEANKYSLEKYGKAFNAEEAETRYKTTQATLKDFTSGKTADNIVAFNTAIGHLDMLGRAAQALNNGKFTLLNQYANELGAKVGKDPLATYNAIHAAVSGEVGKVYKGSAPTDQEMNTMNGAFNQAQSPGQAAAAVGTTMRLMNSKINALDNKFRNGTSGKSPEEKGIHLISPESQDVLVRYGIERPVPATGAPGGAAAPQQQPGNPLGLNL